MAHHSSVSLQDCVDWLEKAENQDRTRIDELRIWEVLSQILCILYLRQYGREPPVPGPAMLDSDLKVAEDEPLAQSCTYIRSRNGKCFGQI